MKVYLFICIILIGFSSICFSQNYHVEIQVEDVWW
jgi:hypothetical protein